MRLFFLLFFVLVFLGSTILVWTVFWGLGKFAGMFIPAAAAIGKWVGVIAAACLMLLYFFGFLFGWKTVKVRRVDLPFKNLPAGFDGYRIAQVSDWHLGTYSKNHATIEKEVRKLMAEKPDLIVFTGDIVNYEPSELRPFIELLSTLDAPDGVWSIMGNHDYCMYYLGNTPEIQARHISELQELERSMGWKMLLNEHIVIDHAGDSLALIGVENDGEPPFPQYSDLPKALSGLPDGIFKILLSHDPTHWRREVLPRTDIDLMLAGHTHAWQFRIGKLSPAMFTFKEWGGLYEEGERKLFVSTGSGGNIRFRFGAWPEIDILTLRKD